MKRIIYFVLCTLMLCACETKWSKDGKLDGMWQVLTIEHPDGTITDVKANKRYWSFRNGLMQMSTSPASTARTLYALYRYDKDKSLRIYDFVTPSHYVTDTDDDKFISIDSVSVVHPWGLHPHADESNNKKVTTLLIIDKLTCDQLILHDDSVKIELRKF